MCENSRTDLKTPASLTKEVVLFVFIVFVPIFIHANQRSSLHIIHSIHGIKNHLHSYSRVIQWQCMLLKTLRLLNKSCTQSEFCKAIGSLVLTLLKVFVDHGHANLASNKEHDSNIPTSI